MDADLAFLERRRARRPPRSSATAGHEWTDDFRAEAGRFLASLL